MTAETEERLLLSLGRIEATLETLKESNERLKDTVDKHEKVYALGKVLGLPIGLGMHLGLSAVWKKLLHL